MNYYIPIMAGLIAPGGFRPTDFARKRSGSSPNQFIA